MTRTDVETGVVSDGRHSWLPIDDDGRYRVVGWPKVAVYVVGVPAEAREEWVCWDEDEDGEELGSWDVVVDCDDSQRVVIMVGDDATHIVDVVDMQPIADEDYCSGCGQIGCGWC